MTRIIFSILFVLSGLPKAAACDCNYSGSFFKMSKQTPLIALIKVTKYLTFNKTNTPMSMEVEMIKKYKGIERRTTLTVWGDNGNLCRPYLSNFAFEAYYIMAFYNGDSDLIDSPEKATEYAIINCGCYWLPVDMNKQTVTGDIDTNNMTLVEFKKQLRKSGR